jgi:hypothetical protein
MKNYIAVHTFKSEELRASYLKTLSKMEQKDIVAAVTGPAAECQMNWMGADGTDNAVCFWKAENPEAIIEQLGDMNNFFDTDSHEMMEEYFDFSTFRQ